MRIKILIIITDKEIIEMRTRILTIIMVILQVEAVLWKNKSKITYKILHS